MTDNELSLQYHSIRFYYGTYKTVDIPYRIGNLTVTIADENENFYDTWIDFHLIPTERPIVQIPKATTKIVNIPGRSVPYDLSTYLTGHPIYSNRTGSWSFYTDVDYIERNYGDWLSFDRVLRERFHGKIFKVVLRDDPLYFYAGEITYSGYQTGAVRSTVSFSYNFYPYKKSIVSSIDLWKWDEFSFEESTILYMKDVVISRQEIIDVYGSFERISPHISASSGITLERLEGTTWKSYGLIPTDPITSSKSIIPGFIIENGLNKLRFTGNGIVTMDYRRGLL